MNKFLAAAAGAICLGLLAPAAGAGPLGVAGGASSAAVPSEIIRVHGLHTACRRDRFGWHRSYLWGREWCSPPHWRRHMRRHHFKKKRH